MPGDQRFERYGETAVAGAGARSRPDGRVDLAVVLNGFPRLSETFVLHELLELERHGLRLHVVALRRPAETVQQEALERGRLDRIEHHQMTKEERMRVS